MQTLKDIYEGLSTYVIGQEDAKKKVATALYQHVLRSGVPRRERERMPKANILMCGPTGSGKTELFRAAAKLLDIPLAIRDATTITTAGYNGEDIEACLYALYEAANHDILAAQNGIIFFDEFDKIAQKDTNPQIRGYNVLLQQSLLKLVEGKVADAPARAGIKKDKASMPFDTSNVLFVLGGAHIGIRPEPEAPPIGFGRIIGKEEKARLPLKPRDFIEFGYVPELVGRLPVIVELEELTVSELTRILTAVPNSILEQYRTLFGRMGTELEFEEGAATALAERAKDLGMGARGLVSTARDLLDELIFTLGFENTKERIVITREDVEQHFSKEQGRSR